MANNLQNSPKKNGKAKKAVIATVAAAAAAYGTLAMINRDADPTTWKGQRSGHEETK